eukprot:359586-Chlamydomonas_euryale.AAC.4
MGIPGLLPGMGTGDLAVPAGGGGLWTPGCGPAPHPPNREARSAPARNRALAHDTPASPSSLPQKQACTFSCLVPW